MKTLITSFLIMTAAVTVLTLLLYAFLRIFGKKLSAKCRYILWCALIVEMCLPLPLLSSAADTLSTAGISARAEHISVYTSGIVDTAEKTFTYTPVAAPDNTPETAEPAKPTKVTDKTDVAAKAGIPAVPEEKTGNRTSLLSRISPLYAAFVVWAAGAVITMGTALVKYARFLIAMRKMKKSGNLCSPNGETAEIYTGLCENMKIKNPPELSVSKSPISPVLYGFFRHRIIIPDGVLSETAKEAVLSHELIHYKRHDLIIKLLCTVATALFWFDPAVYLAAGEIKKEAELSCDDEVLKGQSAEYRVSYGEAMLDIVKKCRKSNIRLVSSFNSTGKKGVKMRFANILSDKKLSGGKGIIALLLAICIAAGTLVACTGYKTDKEDAPETEKTFDENGVPVLVPEKMTYTYESEDDKKTYEAEFSYDGSKIIADRKVNSEDDMSFEFETDGTKMQKLSVYRAGNGKKTLCNVLTKTWDGDNLTEEKYTDGEGNIRYIYNYEYTDGKLMREILDYRTYGTTDTKTYEYDSEDRLLKKISEMTDERKPGEVVTVTREYTYGSDGSVKTTVNGQEDGSSIYVDRNGKTEKVVGNGTTLKYLYDEKGRCTGTSDNYGYGCEIKYYEDTDYVLHREYKGEGKTVSFTDFDMEKLLYQGSDGVQIQWRAGTAEEKKACECVVSTVEEKLENENTYFISYSWEQYLLCDAGLFGGGLIDYSQTPEIETAERFVKNLFSATPEDAAEHEKIIYKARESAGNSDETGIVSTDSEELSEFVSERLGHKPTPECLKKIIAGRIYYRSIDYAKKYSGDIAVSRLDMDETGNSGDSGDTMLTYKFYADIISVEDGVRIDSAVGTVTLLCGDTSWKVYDVNIIN